MVRGEAGRAAITDISITAPVYDDDCINESRKEGFFCGY
jgi:hypothetical protein